LGSLSPAWVGGFKARQRRVAERVKPGDFFVCYVVKLSRWCGLLNVQSGAYEDSKPIFTDENDPFIIRFKVSPGVELDFDRAIPIEQPELWNSLSFTRDLRVRSVGWAQHAKLRQSLVQIPDPDGTIIQEALEEQAHVRAHYPLIASDLRHITERTIVRTEEGEVEVEVPDREETEPPGSGETLEPRTSIRVQASVAHIGCILGFNIWIPAADRARISDALPASARDRLVSILPLNYDLATLKTIENIDVLWLERRSIAHAFEIEHTTAIYSGLLRMADLLAMQPRMQITLHIIAPTERRDQVRREIVRPVFSVLEGGAMAQKCSFLSYDAIEEILRQPNLSHMRESILEEYEEFFDEL
jgi:hypothetical protein